MNVYGELVRWKLVEVQDVYEIYEDEIDSRGTEVFSRLRKNPLSIGASLETWRPGRRSGAR
jgi:hypothetical protein